MASTATRPVPRVMARITVVGVALAVVALGGLALWSAIVTKAQADELSRTSVQVTGHLRAVQALSIIRMQTDALEDDYNPQRLAELRAAQNILLEGLDRMESGEAAEVARVARDARPLAEQIPAAVQRFVTDPKSDINCDGEDCDGTAEFTLGDKLTALSLILNDPSRDPADLLDDRLETVSAADSTIRSAAIALIPLGLGGALASGWLLRVYRRRSESAMRSAMQTSAREARTDQLTGLPNRRALMEELQRRVDAGETFVLAVADLNGFKPYNDMFGHPAGDDLLRRLGVKLASAWQGHGFTAHLGGDEFCVISDDLAPSDLQALLHEALSEQGEGFAISAVSGLAAVPSEAGDASAALGLADTRLYAEKAIVHAKTGGSHGRALLGPSDDITALSLVRMLDERHPGLASHADRVARIAALCAQALALPEAERALIERAARLHDVGKVAIPTAILTKPSTLNDDEWRFMRQHSVIGERILSQVDEGIAVIVRAIHERWEGNGYPDRLAADQIPVGSRIIAVADAFVAMTGERPYASARSVGAAVDELKRCAGTQFDDAVVTVLTDFIEVHGDPSMPAEALSGS
jgi:diguanylate cyclase (GGDEF)-like protein